MAHHKDDRVSRDSLPSEWKGWLLAVQDPSFERHRGIDLETKGAGLTTITQSLVKRLFFDDWRPGPLNKLKQTAIAYYVVHPRVPKAQQLELFMDTAYLGQANGRLVIGFSAAAQAYWSKPLGSLTDREYLSLVAMLIAPHDYEVFAHPRENAERVERIVRLLAGQCSPRNNLDVLLAGCADGATP